jgi:hypothetical protein
MSSGAREEMNMHIQLRLIVSVLALLPSSLCMSQTAEAQRASKPHHTIVPLPQEGLTQERLLKLLGRGFEILSGDPDKAGAPFVIRIYNIENQIVVPHWHPEDEHLTVVKGTWSIGGGETFDRTALREMSAGDYVLVPKTMRHFGWAKTEVITQIHGIGPFKINPVDPWIFLTDPNAPGPFKTDPNAASRFKYKLKDRVASRRGEGGVLFGFSSDKNRVTQYIVRRDDGTVFAEFEEELTTVR